MLAIDLGSRRIGLALSDESGVVAQPFRVLDAEPADTLVGRLSAIAKEAGAAELVVGLPRRLDGSSGPEALQARSLARRLRERTRLPVALFDERLSSVEAQRHLAQVGKRRDRRERSRGVVDQLAATLVLQGYLARKLGR